jgi:tetratricopeptide (TPR) repeat protein
VAEIGKAAPTQGALYGLLRDAPFLLVVGYRGEEEGLMRPLREALKAFPERRIFWALRGDAKSLPDQVSSLRETGCVLQILANQDADELFDTLATGAKLGTPRWMNNPVSVLLHEQRRIVPPWIGVVERLLDAHADELGALSRALTEYRENISRLARASVDLDKMLLEGQFAEARSSLEIFGAEVGAELWVKLAIANAQAVMDGASGVANEQLPAVANHLLRIYKPDQPIGYQNWRQLAEALRGRDQNELAQLCFVAARQEAEAAGPEGNYERSLALTGLAELARLRGDLEIAVNLLREALETQRLRAVEIGSIQAQRDVSATLIKLADVARLRSDLHEASSLLDEAVQIRRSIAEKSDGTGAKRDLAFALSRSSDIARSLGDLSDAETLQTEAISLRRSLAEKQKTPRVRRDLAIALFKLSEIAAEQKKLEHSERLLNEGIKTLRALVSEVKTDPARRMLSVALGRLADISEKKGDSAEAERLHAEALEIDWALLLKLGTDEARQDLAYTLLKLGGLAHERGDTDGAQRFWTEALETGRLLLNSRGTEDDVKNYLIAYQMLEQLARDRGDEPGAKRLRSEANKLRQRRGKR